MNSKNSVKRKKILRNFWRECRAINLGLQCPPPIRSGQSGARGIFRLVKSPTSLIPIILVKYVDYDL